MIFCPTYGADRKIVIIKTKQRNLYQITSIKIQMKHAKGCCCAKHADDLLLFASYLAEGIKLTFTVSLEGLVK